MNTHTIKTDKPIGALRLLLTAFSCLAFMSVEPTPVRADDLERRFANPPNSARPMVFWDWVLGNISREGITRDLEHLKRVGLGGGMIFDVPPLHGNYATAPEPGPVAFMSDEWLDLVNFAAEESHRLGLEFGVVLCSAWNTGGPWIKPKHNNQVSASSVLRVSGPRAGPVLLPPPSADPDYTDVAVLAWPAPDNECRLMLDHPPTVRVNGKPGPERQNLMMDGKRYTVAPFPAPSKGAPTVIELTFPAPATADRLYIQENTGFGIKSGYLETDVDGTARRLADFETDGTVAVDVAFATVTAKVFRLVISEAQVHAVRSGTMRLAEVALMEPGKWPPAAPAIRNLSLKTAAVAALGRKRGERLLPANHLVPTIDSSRLAALDPENILTRTGCPESNTSRVMARIRKRLSFPPRLSRPAAGLFSTLARSAMSPG